MARFACRATGFYIEVLAPQLDEEHQLARHYLTNFLLELNEAAYLLGYEDANSFVRAFRSWEGVPPAHWRGLRRAAAVS